jgi:hypothetical protein
MDGFEFFFTLFGLLLGFSLVEVIAGFGRAIEIAVHPAPATEAPLTRIGWLSPLLGLFVAFNLVSFWTAAWSLRDVIPVHYLALLFGLVVTGGYYLAATLVFPRNIPGGSDLDNHYFQVKRWVLAIVILCNALGAAGMALVGTGSLPNLVEMIFYGLLIALFFARSHRANLLLLIPIAAGYPLTSLIALVL